MYYVHDKRVAVVGLGRSGAAAARLLSVRGAQVVVTDDKPAEKLEGFLQTARALPGVQLALGGLSAEAVLNADLVVVSPGVPVDHELLKAAREKGVKVIGEMELAYGYCPAPVVAITGTNGKTTTTTLTAQMLSDGGRRAVACGNIGRALSEAVFDLSREDWAVLEVSSFQLETVREFKPRVAAVLNITPDHLDRHGSMQAYAELKARVFTHQDAEDAVVLNASDRFTPALLGMTRSRRHLFGFPKDGRVNGTPGCYVVGDALELMGTKLMPLSEIGIPGPHNQENAAAAALMANLCGVEPASIAETLRRFRGVEHRIEFSGEVVGVRFINDSKGTNVDSVEKALQSFPAPIVLILGGRDKKGDFTRLLPLIRERVIRVVAIGEARSKIVSQLSGEVAVVEAGTLEEAVAGAFAAAQPRGTVLLSPGCASFDMFRDYEDRGRRFKAVVADLIRKKEAAPRG
jgi:UDP-N-acetylmuramoylalanine--D-glutamate ligase